MTFDLASADSAGTRARAPSCSEMRARKSRFAVNEKQFRVVAWVVLALMMLVVFSGAAVRLTDSGLGCATWPDCTGGQITPPSGIHAAIEFGNRIFSSSVGVVSGVIAIMSLLRVPRRRDLIWLAWSQPLGVIAQAVLGGFTVREQLNPWFVMAHFMLSIVILIFSVWLVWNSSHEPGTRVRDAAHPHGDRVTIYAVRGLAVLCFLTLIGGTLSTAAGPHSGAHVGQHVGRLHFMGAHTLVWAIEQHATIAFVFGIATVLVWMLKRVRTGRIELYDPLALVAILTASQGMLGALQWSLKLPAQLVWLHVVLATFTWVGVLRAIAIEGCMERRRVRASDDETLDTIVTEWSQSVPAR